MSNCERTGRPCAPNNLSCDAPECPLGATELHRSESSRADAGRICDSRSVDVGVAPPVVVNGTDMAVLLKEVRNGYTASSATVCDLIAIALREPRWCALYEAVSQMMAPLGYHGTISARDDRAVAVMDALHDIDGGAYKKPLSFDSECNCGVITDTTRSVHLLSCPLNPAYSMLRGAERRAEPTHD